MMNSSSVIELGSVQKCSSSFWRQAAVAVAGGAIAGVILAIYVPAQQVSFFAPAVSSSNAVYAPSSVVKNGMRLPSTSSSMESAVVFNPTVEQSVSWQPQAFGPLMVVASGFLMVIAAAVRFFRPAPTTEYSMLLTSAVRTQRERAAQEKEEAKRREIQERLMRLARMGALPAHVQVPAAAPAASYTAYTPAPAPAPTSSYKSGNEWETRQQERERRERNQEEAKRREIQERLARLAAMGFTAPAPVPTPAPAAPVARSHQSSAPVAAPVTYSPSGNISDWERRQQERERREREQEAAKQREIQERLARLAKLGAAPSPAQYQPAPVAGAGVNEWERRQQERERRESEKARAAQREIEERMARLARLSSGR